MSKKELYVYSINGTRYCDREEEKDQTSRGWETREEALMAGRDHAKLIADLKDAPPGPVWTGVKVGYDASAFFPESSVLYESMSDVAEGEVGGDALDGWPDFEDDACDEIDAFVKETLHPFLAQWVEKHGLQPTFWSATEVVKHADDDGELEPTKPATPAKST